MQSEEILRPLDDITVRGGVCNWYEVANAIFEVRRRLEAALSAAEPSVAVTHGCAARKQGTAGGNDAADCNWPICGCDDHANKVIEALQESGFFNAAPPALTAQVQDARSDDDEETYQIGVRDGYSQAVQEIDRLTGGDGEYRYCTDHDPARHTPGPAEMIQRIVDRFETLNLLDEAEKRGDFWDAPGSAQVQDVAVPEGWQLVPKEPTEEMAQSGKLAHSLAAGFGEDWGTQMKDVYRAMLAEAPANQERNP